MKILSWDIGIKNLSYCFLEKDNNILIKDWNIINLEDEILIPKCSSKCKNGNDCKSNSIYLNKDKSIGYCRKHYKTIENKKDFKELKKKKKKKEDLIIIGNKLIHELDKLFSNDIVYDNILLENQPSLKNPTMKSIQMIIYSYFLINGYSIEPKKVNHIQMISATQKNKYCNEYCKKNEEIEKPNTKSPYNNSKKLAILVTQNILEKEKNEYLNFFNENKKKDDLADSYLQGIQYLLKLK